MVPRAPTAAPSANLLGATPVKPHTRHKGPLNPNENLCMAPAASVWSSDSGDDEKPEAGIGVSVASHSACTSTAGTRVYLQTSMPIIKPGKCNMSVCVQGQFVAESDANEQSAYL